MNKIHPLIISIILVTIIITKPILAQNNYQQQRARQELIENEKKWFINKFLSARQQTQDNQHLFDVTSYRLNLRLDPANLQIRGKVTVEGKSLSSGLNQLDLDLSADLLVDSVRQGINTAGYSRSEDLLTISLQQPVNSGEFFNITISYHGNPELTGFDSFGWDYHGSPNTPIIWTLSEPYGSPSWWPCKDEPADKADSVFTTITVPDGLIAVSNGILKSVTQSEPGYTSYSWHTYYPISTYLVSLAVSNYAFFQDWYVTTNNDSMPVDFYVYPEQLSAARIDLSITVDMISFFASVFGEYPFLKEKYGMVTFPWSGAMEHQTITSYGAGLITGNHFFDFLNAHELAHQWFGDCITMGSWSHIWLNEGFASYAEALWEEHVYGKTAYFDYMKAQERYNFSGSLYIADTTDVNALFSSTVYDKGSWVLHMLRGVLGDSLFFASLKGYATHPEFVYGNAVTEDFQAVCEQVSGRDLNWFFGQWVYRPGRPEYTVTWYSSGIDSYKVHLKINQPYSTLYQMPLQVQLQGTGIDTIITIWNCLKVQEFSFRVPNIPETLVIDPQGWVLKRVTISYLGHFKSELPDNFTVSQNYPNPFNQNTLINITLPQQAEVTIDIYNMLGQIVYRDQNTYSAGHETWIWNGRDERGRELPSGLYIYRISNRQATISGKMILIR